MSFPWLPKAQAIRGEWNCSLFHTSITTYFNHPVIHCPCDVYLTNTFPTPLNHSSLFSLCTNSVKSALRSYNKYMQTLTHVAHTWSLTTLYPMPSCVPAMRQWRTRSARTLSPWRPNTNKDSINNPSLVISKLLTQFVCHCTASLQLSISIIYQTSRKCSESSNKIVYFNPNFATQNHE